MPLPKVPIFLKGKKLKKEENRWNIMELLALWKGMGRPKFALYFSPISLVHYP